VCHRLHEYCSKGDPALLPSPHTVVRGIQHCYRMLKGGDPSQTTGRNFPSKDNGGRRMYWPVPDRTQEVMHRVHMSGVGILYRGMERTEAGWEYGRASTEVVWEYFVLDEEYIRRVGILRTR
jgi:hypothetical protein